MSVQSVPHMPQLLLSVLVFTHAPLQMVCPGRHPGTHAPPLHVHTPPVGRVPVHAEHAPLQQSPPAHVVPSLTFPVAPHVWVPVVHDVVPVWHTFPLGLQPTPAVHATHCPLSHTMFVPHEVPFMTLPVELHTGEPLEQLTVPVWQTLPPGLHAWPAVHAPH
jgi:hypothetical protein